jgi:hypothetical protein
LSNNKLSVGNESKTLVTNTAQGIITEGRFFAFVDKIDGNFDFTFTFKPKGNTSLTLNKSLLDTGIIEIVLSIGIDDNRIGRAQSFALQGKLNITFIGNGTYKLEGNFLQPR